MQAKGPIGHVDETAPIDPPAWAPYTRSKAAAEKFVLEANDPPKFECEQIASQCDGFRLFS